MFELEPLPPGIRLLTNPEAERLKKRHPKLPASPQHCPTCKGKGTFSWWSPDTNEPVEWKCNCPDQWVLHRYLLHSNVLKGYQRLGWRDATNVEAGAIDKVWDYIDNAESYVDAGYGLILHGLVGNGKTLLSSLVFKALLAQGHDGYFTSFSEMIGLYTQGWRDNEERAWFHSRVKNTTVLVLDDIGREFSQTKYEYRSPKELRAIRESGDKDYGRVDFASGLSESTFDEVLRHRIAAALPTIITTNLDMNKLGETYGGNVLSLLKERSATYQFAGQDFRGRAEERLATEMRLKLTRPLVIG